MTKRFLILLLASCSVMAMTSCNRIRIAPIAHVDVDDIDSIEVVTKPVDMLSVSAPESSYGPGYDDPFAECLAVGIALRWCSSGDASYDALRSSHCMNVTDSDYGSYWWGLCMDNISQMPPRPTPTEEYIDPLNPYPAIHW